MLLDDDMMLESALEIEYLLVAGGAGGGGADATDDGGGGGAGGCFAGLAIIPSATSIAITLGAGGAADADGGDSVIAGIKTVEGGGAGGQGGAGAGNPGGSGGGGNPDSAGGAGTAGQGYAGGNGNGVADAGGGGGAGGAGSAGTAGAGLSSSITGTPVTYARGGAPGITAGSPATNPGWGGDGGGAPGGPGHAGAPGRCVIRYRGPQRATGGTITTISVSSVSYTVHDFTSSGTFAVL